MCVLFKLRSSITLKCDENMQSLATAKHFDTLWYIYSLSTIIHENIRVICF